LRASSLRQLAGGGCRRQLGGNGTWLATGIETRLAVRLDVARRGAARTACATNGCRCGRRWPGSSPPPRGPACGETSLAGPGRPGSTGFTISR
jgi:hypothetical protein